MPMVELFATAAKGTEPALRDELRELGLRGVRADRGGVHFGRTWEDGWRACLHSRIAIRVLANVARFEARDKETLYEGARTVRWLDFVDPRRTLAVSAVSRASSLTHTNYIAQRTKDAIVDQIRDAVSARPSVDRRDPDLHVFVHIVRDRASVFVDLSGESLHKRGYRARAGEAPLKETLAAAIVRMSGWDRERPLLDPMCGAGTIAIEAAMWANGVAPGLFRARFGFERWALFDRAAAERMRALRGDARAQVRRDGPEVLGSDVDDDVLDRATANARAAGVRVRFARRSIADLAPSSPPGHVITNPPYGKRLAAAPNLYSDLGRALARLEGHRVTVLAGDPRIPRILTRKPLDVRTLFNGDLECKLVTYEVPRARDAQRAS